MAAERQTQISTQEKVGVSEPLVLNFFEKAGALSVTVIEPYTPHVEGILSTKGQIDGVSLEIGTLRKYLKDWKQGKPLAFESVDPELFKKLDNFESQKRQLEFKLRAENNSEKQRKETWKVHQEMVEAGYQVRVGFQPLAETWENGHPRFMVFTLSDPAMDITVMRDRGSYEKEWSFKFNPKLPFPISEAYSSIMRKYYEQENDKLDGSRYYTSISLEAKWIGSIGDSKIREEIRRAERSDKN